MEITLIQYGIFIVVALVLIGLVVALNRRLSRQRHSHSSADILGTWAKLDARRAEGRDPHTAVFGDDEDEEIAELHARASQNGHHAESQK
jgi:hypothetical protein